MHADSPWNESESPKLQKRRTVLPPLGKDWAVKEATMSTTPTIHFRRRVNRDGSMFSICVDCLARVATSHFEAELDKAEECHVCQESDLGKRFHAPDIRFPKPGA